VVFDLPPIVPFTQEIIAGHRMQERVTARPGNYFLDELTEGNDLVLLSNSLQTEGVQPAGCSWAKCSRLWRLVGN
jgi:hypothetical protein